ncbi:3-hydroxyacyl-CoA dehydrogenase family protein [Methylomonas fluvii]|uniref:3-hydroxybutyryl-CoA dehydrogenase n=1 Tax=Methylomonas fluvii TaxID=1854564 RepID=A0ABR9DDM3_9GAMM|nr:3-hydroxyacyl-CoA dehydrogenase NAD-binding domain-containing protein [Methylomonas fluvii]MBD9360881.1 3-hydroxybutyryl-CoA dehydrogenase [Methylomonas fluvii]CAD6873753.1 3-hydroxybutyryl-CoA dehydrogenase (EC 1.1.1.157) [Methylomonas fluvii]
MQNHVVGIAGAGNMGMQLAILFASHDIATIIWNHKEQPSYENDIFRLATIQSKLGFFNKENIKKVIEHISYANDITVMEGCDFIVEAIKEDKEVKAIVLRQIDAIARQAKVLATNTSMLSITELASFTENPSRFLGIHFFNPPMSMKLIEVIKGELTSDAALEFALNVLDKINKHPVVIPETPGFIVNRLLFPMINEAVFLLSEGISDAKTIDNCMRLGANHPMGPLELADLIGLDICLSILETLMEETGDVKYRPAILLKRYVRAGKLGKKTGIGFYSYRKKI